MGADEEGTLAALSQQLGAVNERIAAYGGRVFGSAGDSVVAEFPSVVEAVRCAVEIQRGADRHDTAAVRERRLQFRIGINLGDVLIEWEDVFGDGVNVAARLEAMAMPGGICISRKVYDEVRGKLDVAHDDLGEQQLKNIAEPIRVYQIRVDAGAPLPARRSAVRRWRRPIPAASIALALTAIAVVLWLRPWALPPEVASGSVPVSSDRSSVLVLPFDNLSDDPAQEYFSDGMTEELIAALTRFPNLQVLGRNTTFALKDRDIDSKQLIREFGVRYLLTGSVKRAGDRIRITAQLIETATGLPRWTERYERDLIDVFAIQDEVTQRVVGTIVSQIGRSEILRLLKVPPENLHAYELTLQGRRLWQQSTKESVPEARRLLERAIEADPLYAPAYVYAAFTYLTAYNNNWNEEYAAPETIEQMARLARQAIQLDGSYALAHATHAVALIYSGQHQGALAEAERAIALNPNDSDVLGRVSQVLVFAGQHARAIEIVGKAIELDPLPPAQWLNYLSRARYFLGDDEPAAKTAESCIDTAPLRPCFETLIAAYGQLGRSADAQAVLAKFQGLNPDATATGAVKRLRQVFLNQADLDRLVDGLRKAGLPD